MSSVPTLLSGLARVSPKPWAPHTYQRRGVEFLCGTGCGALFLKPGRGKTSVVLAAFDRLRQERAAQTMLVVAPLRVCQTVWRQEAAKWSDFNHLRFEVLHGPRKADVLVDALGAAEPAEVYLINPEGVPWLSEQCKARGGWPFDIVTLDELTRFKNARAQRHKVFRPFLRYARRRWGLTGTPAPNGYLDLFGQFLILDDGAALGKFITHYRSLYFTPAPNGFDWKLQPGAEQRIEDRIRPYVLRMGAEEELELPDLTDDVRTVLLPKAVMAVYKQMKHDMLAALPGGVVTAQNAGGVANKLRQIASGAVYESAQGKEGEWAKLHDVKLDAVAELLEDLAGQPLLLAYEYQHELERLRERFPNTPYLGAGVSQKRTEATVDAWNRGELPLLLAHPKSAGHGLNLQGCGCSDVAWFGPTYDLELYRQFIDRVRRQGNTSEHVVNHVFVAQGTIDEQVLQIVADKRTTEDGLMKRLADAITQESDMEKLGTLNGQLPKGWGPPPAAQEPEQKPTPQEVAQAEMLRESAAKATTTKRTQKEAIRDKLTGGAAPDRSAIVAGLFGNAKQPTEVDTEKPAPEQTVVPPFPIQPTNTVSLHGVEMEYDKLAAAFLRQIGKALASL